MLRFDRRHSCRPQQHHCFQYKLSQTMVLFGDFLFRIMNGVDLLAVCQIYGIFNGYVTFTNNSENSGLLEHSQMLVYFYKKIVECFLKGFSRRHATSSRTVFLVSTDTFVMPYVPLCLIWFGMTIISLLIVWQILFWCNGCEVLPDVIQHDIIYHSVR